MVKMNNDYITILDEIDPTIEGEDGESRKGMIQIHPLICIKEHETYWCDKVKLMIPVPQELVGTWICSELVDKYYYDTWERLRGFNWERAEQIEITTLKWVPQR